MRNFLVQLVTITAGVLIALFFEGLVEWNNNRALVREARATIVREMSDNKRELDSMLADLDTRRRNIDNALKLVNELLRDRKSDVRQIDLGLTVAELGAASWQTAERTGALGHMEYGEVQRYSKVYAWQEVFVASQRKTFDHLAQATAILTDAGPHEAPLKDLEMFRQYVLALHGDLLMQEQFGKRLTELYAAELKR